MKQELKDLLVQTEAKLNETARARGLLAPSEYLILDGRIGGKVPLKSADVNPPNKTRVLDFFAISELIARGVPKALAVRTFNAIRYQVAIRQQSPEMTMQEFREHYPTIKKLGQIRSIGGKCTREAVRVLREQGFAIEGDV